MAYSLMLIPLGFGYLRFVLFLGANLLGLFDLDLVPPISYCHYNHSNVEAMMVLYEGYLGLDVSVVPISRGIFKSMTSPHLSHSSSFTHLTFISFKHSTWS